MVVVNKSHGDLLIFGFPFAHTCMVWAFLRLWLILWCHIPRHRDLSDRLRMVVAAWSGSNSGHGPETNVAAWPRLSAGRSTIHLI
jgi:hypothetical protein